MQVHRASEKLADFIFPRNIYCECCKDVLPSRSVYALCDSCMNSFDWLLGNPGINTDDFYFDSVFSVINYDEYARKIIYSLKFDGSGFLADTISSVMAEAFDNAGNYDCIVYVPMHKDKEKLRGFNQTELIAHGLGKRLGISVVPDALVKKANTASMRRQRGHDRRTLLDDTILVNSKKLSFISGKRMLLIDDVITTGSTANVCSKALKAAGAGNICVFSFAAVSGRGKISQSMV